MTEWKTKRFWKEVAVMPQAEGFAIHLDERPVRTPAKALLVVPTHDLGKMIAQEWRDQGDDVDPQRMIATRTANVAIDKVATQMDAVVSHLVEYGGSDLLCYRAQGPEELVRRQAQGWDPLLEWSANTLMAPLLTGPGVMPIAQPQTSLERFRSELQVFDPFSLSAFHEMVSMLGSLVLAFGVARKRLDSDQAWLLSCLDEQYQLEKWGHDEEASEAAAIKRTGFLTAAAIFDSLCAKSE